MDDAFAQAVSAAGGKFDKRQAVLYASFGGSRIGFLLDMLIFLEKMKKTLEDAGRELLGHSLVLCNEIREGEAERLCRNLSGGAVSRFSGIWCCRKICKDLEPYGIFETSSLANRDYKELKTLENPSVLQPQFPYREKIAQALLQGPEGNVLAAGPPFIGKQDGVYQFCKTILGDIPPLVLRFENANPACFTDALTGEIRSFLINSLASGSKSLDVLDSLGLILSKERLRKEFYPALVETARRFLKLLVSVYGEAVRSKKAVSETTGRPVPAVILLENIGRPDKGNSTQGNSGFLFRELYSDFLEKRSGFLIIGTASIITEGMPPDESASADELRNWNNVFPSVLNLASGDFDKRWKIDIPLCLLDISYTFSILGRFFHSRFFPLLFEEEGLNPEIPDKARKMLEDLGIIDELDDLKPRIPDFSVWAGSLSLSLKDTIHSMVRNRLLAWADSGFINPCFALLGILETLKYKANDALVLRIIREDVFTGAYSGIEKFAESGGFRSLAGLSGGSAMLMIFRMLKSLVWEPDKSIEKTFSSFVSEETQNSFDSNNFGGNALFPGFRAQYLVNMGSYMLGAGQLNEAEKTVKEAVLINQSFKDKALPAYRLFSLVNLAKNKLNDAIGYIQFAVDQNGQYGTVEKASNQQTASTNRKTDEFAEQLKTLYFAAVIHFIYGNLSKAEYFALKIEGLVKETGIGGSSLDSNNGLRVFSYPVPEFVSEWTAKARFLRGRLRFEAGEYQEALELFNSLSADASGGPSLFTPEPCDRDKTLAAWIYRAKIFLYYGGNALGMGLHHAYPVKPSLPNSDGRLFIAEAAFLAGNYKEAASLTEDFLRDNSGNEFEAHTFLYTEQVDWRSGFSQCENIVIPEGSSLHRLARFYRAMALCSLGVDEDTRKKLCSEGQDFLRRELLPDGETGDVFFYYAYYYILQKTEGSQVDMETTVSAAFKRLQRRAVRIDDDRLRQTYTSKNYWNSILGQAAKKYRLI
ncbi:MAG: hypothetical protein LBH43_18500 [Treponema sp.]|nr:hypothetical protein [Treponema sp.]